MKNLIGQISADLNIPGDLIEKAFAQAHVKYKKIRIPKRSGGYRIAIQPTVELKLIQDWFLTRVLSKLPVHEIATAFKSGSSILGNAIVHRNAAYAIRVDIASFFPSIKFDDLAKALVKNEELLPPVVTTESFNSALRLACFDAENRLPIGYPSSPLIANVVMHEFDKQISERISSAPEIYGTAKVTRYADDFIFSTDKKGACHSFLAAIKNLVDETDEPKLLINESKTRFMSRLGGSMIITGLRVTNESEVRVHANYRDHVRLLLKLYAKNRISEDEQRSLLGHLAFIEHADPKLFTRLSFRYYEEISRLRSLR